MSNVVNATMDFLFNVSIIVLTYLILTSQTVVNVVKKYLSR